MKSCFVVMPFGRSSTEHRWYKGWYEMVIEPAVAEAGFTPVLAAAQEQPDAINDEIRRHLAMDEMVVVDLGGVMPADSPNPNVMYELGVRHAFGLPLVVMAWEGQVLPFDISNQRAIMCSRDMLDILPTRRRLVSFIRSASEGRYYKPMEAVGRQAQLAAASSGLEEDSVLKSLIAEIEDLKKTRTRPRYLPRVTGTDVRSYLSKRIRKELSKALIFQGYTPEHWNELQSVTIPPELRTDAMTWESDSWMSFLSSHAAAMAARRYPSLVATGANINGTPEIDESLIKLVKDLLPPQPWPKDIHKIIAASLGTSNAQVTRAINKLVQRGDFLPQIAGVLYRPSAESDTKGA